MGSTASRTGPPCAALTGLPCSAGRDQHVPAPGLVQGEALAVRPVVRGEPDRGGLRARSGRGEQVGQRDPGPGHRRHPPAGHALEVAHQRGLRQPGQLGHRPGPRPADQPADGDPHVGRGAARDRGGHRVEPEAGAGRDQLGQPGRVARPDHRERGLLRVGQRPAERQAQPARARARPARPAGRRARPRDPTPPLHPAPPAAASTARQ